MGRYLLMGLLAFGAIAGFGSGFARIYHYRHGDSCEFRGVERRAAEACTRAAMDVLEERKTSAQNR
jgi:hypothetical protein